jgi:phenylpropionate dioxygenase-like ring-hydroxylating dioxygenase large terminal subunit
MVSQRENELLTQTGPGTPMGEVFRRYWMPAALSWEIEEPDSPPIKVKLLGEKLVAFRDTQGRVGVVTEVCPHRCASLWLGRNEESGLRCVFHGWKFDVHGNCLEMPNEPAETDFKHRIHLKAYPTVEMGGVIWAYLGPAEKMPPPPRFEWTQTPENYRQVTKTWEECNWLQGLEGGIDSIHSSFLHRSLTGKRNAAGLAGYRATAISARLDVDVKDYGFIYASRRPLGDGREYVRTYHYVMPFTQIRAAQGETTDMNARRVHGHMWVPMDDENHMVFNWHYSFGDAPLPDDEWRQRHPTYEGGEQTPDFRKVRNPSNNWLIDRQRQRVESFTGIEGINTQDHAVQESMGPIVDRTQEHLGTTDKSVITARRLLLESAKTVAEGGDPLGADDSYYHVRAIERVLPADADWRGILGPEIYPELALAR